jgi:hypothetical protein
MRNMEKRKFEDSWKDAFNQAEISPSENVWTNIELDLEKAKGNNLKRKLLFFQLLAAASVVFAMGISVGVYVMGTKPVDPQLLTTNTQVKPDGQKVQTPEVSPSTMPQDNSSESNSSTSTLANDKTSTIKNNKRSIQGSNTVATPVNESVVPLLPNDKTTVAENQVNFYSPSLAALELKEQRLASDKKAEMPVMKTSEEEVVADPVAVMLAKLEEREKAIQKEEKKSEKQTSETLWTSVGFAAGSFNPVNSGVTASSRTMAMSQNNSIANQEVKASGITYSIGANVGTKLSDRWVFQGGVNYLTQSADYTANNVVGSADFSSFRPATIHELDQIARGDSPDESMLVATSPYNVNNSLRYLSIPLQAGYLIVNRDFGIQLNAGIATDVFLQNTVTAEGEGVQATNQEIGEDTPYRSVNLSGLMGTELSYRFSHHYRISLNPGLRYPFSSIYRSELNVKATPLTFDVGVRFRYIFK